MSQSLTTVGTLYSSTVGFVFVFNLICGTGVLTMPKAFDEAGWILSLFSVAVLAAIGYLTVTFLIESMAVANAILKLEGKVDIQKKKRQKKASEEKTSLMDEEEVHDLTYSGGGGSSGGQISGGSGPVMSKSKEAGQFNHSGTILSTITMRVELGQMASMFYPKKFMVIIFYLMMCIYLYGDMAIYSVAVPKSLRHIACTYQLNITGNMTESVLRESDPCWDGTNISRMNAYRIFLTAFILLFGPFIFFNVQKTKYLQIFTITTRVVSFATMIILVLIRLGKGYEARTPELANFAGLPTLFGVCVYSFMTHHSLPSLVTPIKNKSNLLWVLGGDYIAILVLCAVLSVTGVFAFNNLWDLYSLNFFHDKGPHPILRIAFIEYFLALFPVFTLSTSFPLIGVTLRNNLITLGHLFRESFPQEKILFPLLALLPPVAVAMISTNVEFLVSITGSYAGAMIQYTLPAAMVYYARKQFKEAFGEDAVNKHKSPFTHWIWLLLVFVWFVICIVFVTVHHILSHIVIPHTHSHNHHTNVTTTLSP